AARRAGVRERAASCRTGLAGPRRSRRSSRALPYCHRRGPSASTIGAAPVTFQPPPEILARRAAQLRSVLAPLGVERLVVTTLPNVTWLTGFDGSAAGVLVRPHDVVLMTDARYREAAREIAEQIGDGISVVVVDDTYDETIV